ncbi:MAG: CopG family transcriptional regulator [Desulfobacteraceae bacterium]|nr:CopG family transcriptional regulator [Desulfobacteraceae bacterium]
MKNIQISFDEKIIEELDYIVSVSSLSRSEIIAEALRHWFKQREIKAFEDDWIEKLKQQPDTSEDAEKWIQVQTWSE